MGIRLPSGRDSNGWWESNPFIKIKFHNKDSFLSTDMNSFMIIKRNRIIYGQYICLKCIVFKNKNY